MLEAFGTGTAAVISPVKGFKYKDKLHQLKIDESKGIGELAGKLLKKLYDI